MSIRDEDYNWKYESDECTREIRKIIEPIFEKYKDKFSFEDLYYLICTETNSVIIRKVMAARMMTNKKEKA